MRHAYIVTYDITNDRRLRKVFKTMYGFGMHVQLSVFRCELTPADKVQMLSKLSAIVKHDEDQVLVIDIGPADGRAEGSIESVGRPFINQHRAPIIV